MQHPYSESENATWQMLLTKRHLTLPSQACTMYLQGLDNLRLPFSYIPTIQEMNEKIEGFSSWKMIPNNELIHTAQYFKMLASCHFPVVTTIRPSSEIDFYTSPKPDVVHEYFGHGPFLTFPRFGQFLQTLARRTISYSLAEKSY